MNPIKRNTQNRQIYIYRESRLVVIQGEDREEMKDFQWGTVSFWRDKNVLKLIVDMVEQLCKYTKEPFKCIL